MREGEHVLTSDLIRRPVNSAYNPYMTTPPAIVYEGSIVGYLTKNDFPSGAIDPDQLFAAYGCVY